jgi:hypothetical protein
MSEEEKNTFISRIYLPGQTEETLLSIINTTPEFANNTNKQTTILNEAKKFSAIIYELSSRKIFTSSRAPRGNKTMSYGYLRSGLCKTDSTKEFSIGIPGKVEPHYVSSTAHPTFESKTDVCTDSAGVTAITGGTHVTEYRCNGRVFRMPTSNTPASERVQYMQTSPCAYGCSQGACRLGQINMISPRADATSTTVLTGIINQADFYLHVTMEKVPTVTDARIELSYSSTGADRCS